MPYERFGYALLPGWNGADEPTWPPAGARLPAGGTLWAQEIGVGRPTGSQAGGARPAEAGPGGQPAPSGSGSPSPALRRGSARQPASRTLSAMMRRLAAVSLAVMVSACSGPDGTRRQASSQASLEAALSRPAAWAQASGGASAIAMLPSGAGEVAQVRERDYLNGFGQEITLKGGSAAEANRVEITVAGQAGGRGDALAPMAKPSEAGIKAEIAARFPGLAMQVVTRPMKNAYGPYGLAVGRQPGAPGASTPGSGSTPCARRPRPRSASDCAARTPRSTSWRVTSTR